MDKPLIVLWLIHDPPWQSEKNGQMRDDGVLAEPMSLQVLLSNDFTGPFFHGKNMEDGNAATRRVWVNGSPKKIAWKVIYHIFSHVRILLFYL